MEGFLEVLVNIFKVLFFIYFIYFQGIFKVISIFTKS